MLPSIAARRDQNPFFLGWKFPNPLPLLKTRLNTKLSAWLTLTLLMGAAAAVSAVEPSAAKTKVTFDDKRLSSIQVEGKERLISGTPSIWRMKTLSGAVLPMKLLSSTFDQAARKFTATYPWGSVVSTYATLPQGLRIRTVISNTSRETITELGFNMISLIGLGDKQKLGRPTFGVEGPPLIQAAGADGSLVYALEANDKPLMLELEAATDGHTKAAVVNCHVNLGGERVIVDNVTPARPIAPEAQDEFAVEVRLGGVGSSPLDLAQDFIIAYRHAHPPLLSWPDRRPILRLFFNGGLPREQAIANLKDPDNAKPPAPDANYQAFVLARMKGLVEAAKVVNAQGVILWDLEGETFPHATTYIGDPRLIRLLNPQMEMVIDKGIKILKEGRSWNWTARSLTPKNAGAAPCFMWTPISSGVPTARNKSGRPDPSRPACGNACWRNIPTPSSSQRLPTTPIIRPRRPTARLTWATMARLNWCGPSGRTRSASSSLKTPTRL